MTVAATVPRHLTITELRFGISTGIVGGGAERHREHAPDPGALPPAAVRRNAHARDALAYPASPPRHQPLPGHGLVRSARARERRAQSAAQLILG
jgi:hypothetical protein